MCRRRKKFIKIKIYSPEVVIGCKLSELPLHAFTLPLALKAHISSFHHHINIVCKKTLGMRYLDVARC
jgi:hypothetical protein